MKRLRIAERWFKDIIERDEHAELCSYFLHYNIKDCDCSVAFARKAVASLSKPLP